MLYFLLWGLFFVQMFHTNHYWLWDAYIWIGTYGLTWDGWSYGFLAHWHQQLPCVICVWQACLLQSHVYLEPHVSHQLVHTVPSHLAQLYLISHVHHCLLSFHHGLCRLVQPFLRKLDFRPEVVVLYCVLYALGLHLGNFCLYLSLLHLLLNFPTLYWLTNVNFWLVFCYLFALFLLLLFLFGFECFLLLYLLLGF